MNARTPSSSMGRKAASAILAITTLAGSASIAGCASTQADDAAAQSAAASSARTTVLASKSSDTTLLVRSVEDGGGEAIVAGILSTNDQNCVTLEVPGNAPSYVLVAPASSRMAEDGAIHLEGYGDYSIGDDVELTGGLHESPVGDLEGDDPRLTCVPDSDSTIRFAFTQAPD